jgi:hypothetical protein
LEIAFVIQNYRWARDSCIQCHTYWKFCRPRPQNFISYIRLYICTCVEIEVLLKQTPIRCTVVPDTTLLGWYACHHVAVSMVLEEPPRMTEFVVLSTLLGPEVFRIPRDSAPMGEQPCRL